MINNQKVVRSGIHSDQNYASNGENEPANRTPLSYEIKAKGDTS